MAYTENMSDDIKITIPESSPVGTTVRIEAGEAKPLTVTIPHGHWEKTDSGAVWVRDEPRETIIAPNGGAKLFTSVGGNWSDQDVTN